MEKITLSQKFLEGGRLSLTDNLRINLLQRLEDCDGMCGFNSACVYCEIYRSMCNQNKKEYKNN